MVPTTGSPSTDSRAGSWRRLVVGTSIFAVASMSLPAAATADTHAAAGAGTTVQVSVRTGGFAPGAGGNGGSRHTERRLLSDDGRFAVFEASGPVVPGQKNLDWQVVQRDRQLGTTTLISKSTGGAKADKGGGSPSMSADGRFIAFASAATNLVAGDTNGISDVFVHDTRTSTTTRVSVKSNGQQVVGPPGTASSAPSISANGRFVTFLSDAAGLAPGDSSDTQAYLHDRNTGKTEVVSLGSAGQTARAMTTASVSNDGNRILFMSGDAGVAPGANNLDVNVFLRDRSAGTTKMVAGANDGASHAVMSADGRFAAYQTKEAGIDPADTGNTNFDVYVVDLTTLVHTLVSKSSAGVVGNQESRFPSISSDGRYVTFMSQATNLVAGDTNGAEDVFRHDRSTGQTIRVSVAADGAQSVSQARAASISGDGQHVLFDSHDRTLTRVETGTWGQVFVRDLNGKWPALHAKIGTLPKKTHTNRKIRIPARDIRTGPALQVTWQPLGATKGKVVRRGVKVKGDFFTLRAPKRLGSYRVTVSYADNTLRSRDIKVVKPTVKKMRAAIKKGKALKIRTVGLNNGQKVQVRFKPRGVTRGKVVKRIAKVNKKGVVKVKAPVRKGTFRVIVRANGKVLRKAPIQIR